jgi:hypothetical protein
MFDNLFGHFLLNGLIFNLKFGEFIEQRFTAGLHCVALAEPSAFYGLGWNNVRLLHVWWYLVNDLGLWEQINFIGGGRTVRSFPLDWAALGVAGAWAACTDLAQGRLNVGCGLVPWWAIGDGHWLTAESGRLLRLNVQLGLWGLNGELLLAGCLAGLSNWTLRRISNLLSIILDFFDLFRRALIDDGLLILDLWVLLQGEIWLLLLLGILWLIG